MGFGMTLQALSYCQHTAAFTQSGRLQNWKQNALWHLIQVRENGSSLHFNFTLLPSPVEDENWVSLLCCLSLKSYTAYAVPIDSNFLWTANLLTFPLSRITTLLCLVHMSILFCSSSVTLTKLCLIFRSALFFDFSFLSQILGGAPYIRKHHAVHKLQNMQKLSQRLQGKRPSVITYRS